MKNVYTTFLQDTDDICIEKATSYNYNHSIMKKKGEKKKKKKTRKQDRNQNHGWTSEAQDYPGPKTIW